jgi:hypothetical protein
MTAAGDLSRAVLAALDRVDGLRPSTPSAVPTVSWLLWELNTLAVDIGQDVVSVQVVATRLPLPALLEQANNAIRPVLEGTGWAGARLRLVVTDIDRAALKRGVHHPKGP